MQLAQAHVRRGDFAAAQRVCERGLEVRQDHAAGHLSLGRALRGLKRYGPAIQHLRRSLDLAPEDKPAYLELAEVQILLDRFTNALEVVDEAIARWPEDAVLRGLRDRTSEGQTRELTEVRPPGDEQPRPPPIPAPTPTPHVDAPGSGAAPGEDAEDGVDRPPLEVEGATAVRPASGPLAQGTANLPAGRPGPIMPGLSDPGVGWQDLEGRWRDVLDARVDQSSDPDALSDLREPPTPAQRLDIDLPPLSDPLAAGMPPLPEDEGLAARSARPDSGRSSSPSMPVPSGDLSPDGVDESAVMPPLHNDALTAVGSPGYEADLLTPPVQPADVRAMLPTASADELDAGEWEASAAVPPVFSVSDEAPLADTGGDPYFDEGATTDPKDARPVEPEDRFQRVSAAPLPPRKLEFAAPMSVSNEVWSAHPSSVSAMVETGGLLPAEGGQGDGDRPPAARRPRHGRWIIVLALLALVMLGGVGAWWLVRGDRLEADALSAIRRAKMVCTASEVADAARRVRRVSSLRPARALKAQVELVQALAWLCGGAPRPQGSVSGGGSLWARRAVRAALALARGDPAVALGQLEAVSTADPLDKAIQAALLAWTAWLGNRPQDALQWAKAALGRSQLLSLAWLVQGHVYREIGQIEQAEASYRELVERYPAHQPARLALAELRMATSRDHGSDAEDVDGSGSGVVVSGWRRLLEAERTWRTEHEQAGKAKIRTAVAEAPDRREILVHGMRLLGATRQYAAARKALERLTPDGIAGQQSGVRDPVLLRAELAQYRGADALALELVGQTNIPSPYYQRQRVWAALHAMRFRRGAELLAQRRPRLDDDSADALSLAFRPERVKTISSPKANERLAAAVGLGRRGRCDEVDALVADLTSDALLGPRAAVLVGRCLLHRGHYLGARKLVAELDQSSAGFLPPRELAGEVGVVLGTTVDVVRSLEAVHSEGCRTAAGLLALAHGYLDLGWTDRAEQAIQTAQSSDAPPAGLAAVRAHLALVHGQPAKAIKMLGAVKRSTFEGLLIGARAEMSLKRFAEAGRWLATARRVRPTDARIALQTGRSLVLQNDEAAVGELTRVIDRASRSPAFKRSAARAHLLLARVEAKQRRRRRRRRQSTVRERVRAQLNAAVVADPDFWLAWRRLGRDLLRSRQQSKARQALERSAKLNPRDAGSLYWLARACRTDAVCRKAAYQRFLKIEPKGWRARRVRRALAALSSKK